MSFPDLFHEPEIQDVRAVQADPVDIEVGRPRTGSSQTDTGGPPGSRDLSRELEMSLPGLVAEWVTQRASQPKFTPRYQSLYGEASRFSRISWKAKNSRPVWLKTPSTTTRIPFSWQRRTKRANLRWNQVCGPRDGNLLYRSRGCRTQRAVRCRSRSHLSR